MSAPERDETAVQIQCAGAGYVWFGKLDSHSATIDSFATAAIPQSGQRSGVAEYWIINLIDRVVEVYRHPHQVAGGKWTYDAPAIKRAGDGIDVLAMPGATVAAGELLPGLDAPRQ
ncbi:MAG: hypothetical protein H7144_05665 [Burkholderiales bacterium]|nr:hypothetical protein [Phycisphaerae bacterium]